jgi:uncharacterized protein YifN (PemK superfamily)
MLLVVMGKGLRFSDLSLVIPLATVRSEDVSHHYSLHHVIADLDSSFQKDTDLQERWTVLKADVVEADQGGQESRRLCAASFLMDEM